MRKYRIGQDELWEFLARQARLVEQLPAGAEQAAADGYSDGLDDSEPEQVWLAAGIATFIGQAFGSALLGSALWIDDDELLGKLGDLSGASPTHPRSRRIGAEGGRSAARCRSVRPADGRRRSTDHSNDRLPEVGAG
jgi:hypothetical protein